MIVAFSKAPTPTPPPIVRMLRALDVQVDIVPRLYELVGPRVDMHTVEGLPLIGLPPIRPRPAALQLKRAIDLAGAAIGLLLLAPLFGFIAGE